MANRGLKWACALLLIVLGSRWAMLYAESGQPVKVPRIVGEYVTVYRPAADRFSGPDTTELKAGRWYDEWVPNDHTILKGPDGVWDRKTVGAPISISATCTGRLTGSISTAVKRLPGSKPMPRRFFRTKTVDGTFRVWSGRGAA